MEEDLEFSRKIAKRPSGCNGAAFRAASRPAPDLAAEAGRAGLPLHAFPWSEAARAAGFARDAAYLVRPDGHVALAGARAGTLAAYLRRWGIAPQARPGGAPAGREQR